MADIKDTKKTLSHPKHDFRNGIIDTEYDTGQGFVSDLKNMEIDRGIAKRRLGTRVLSDVSKVNLWTAFYRARIGGMEVHLQINEKKQVYAWLEKWPEIDFKVCKRNFSTGTHIIFSKNSDKYWFLEDNKYVYIVSNFGEVKRINKFGSVMMVEQTTQDSEWKPRQMREEIRISNKLPVMMLDIEDMTYEDIDRFITIDDIDDNIRPITGEVRIASVNEAGYIGKFSDPVHLSDYERILISMEDGITGTKSREKNKEGIRFKPTFKDAFYSSNNDNGSLYITRSTDLNSESLWQSNCMSQDSFDYDMQTDNFTGKHTAELTARIILTEGQYAHMYFDAFSDSSAGGNHADLSIDETLANFIELRDIKFIDIIGHGETKDFDDDDKYGVSEELIAKVFSVNSNLRTWEASGESMEPPLGMIGSESYTSEGYVLTSAGTPLTYTLTCNKSVVSTGDHNRFFYVLDLDQELLESIAPISRQNFVFSDKSGTYTVDGWLIEATINVKDSGVDEGSFDMYDLASCALKYKEGWINKAAYVMKNIGYDSWEYEQDYLRDDDILEVLTDTSILLDTSDRQIDLLLKDSSNVSDFLTDGIRFAVWNDGAIVGVSQVGWQNEALSNIAYDVYDSDYAGKEVNDSVDGRGRNVNQIPQSLIKTYLPVCKLEYQGLRGTPYDINELTEYINNPQHIASNGGVLYAIQGQRLWLGQTAKMLLEQPIDIDFNVDFVSGFNNGIALFTDKGIYIVSTSGDITKVDNKRVKAITEGYKGIFFITLKDEVYFLSMVYSNNINSARQAKSELISNQIYHLNWGASPKMIYFDDGLWIARGDDIYCFRQGAWTKRYLYEGKIINDISYFHNELVVSFKDETKILEYLDTQTGGFIV